jgi:transcriptional regulator with GAF, ATPase, and Fis domain
MEEDRELIALAAKGATVTEAAAKLHTSARTIGRKARALGIQLQKARQGKIGLKAKRRG